MGLPQTQNGSSISVRHCSSAMAITLLFAAAPCMASFDAISCAAIACLFGCVLDTSEFNCLLDRARSPDRAANEKNSARFGPSWVSNAAGKGLIPPIANFGSSMAAESLYALEVRARRHGATRLAFRTPSAAFRVVMAMISPWRWLFASLAGVLVAASGVAVARMAMRLGAKPAGS
jgi:hypothetical protein